ncbi:MAG: mechanosensitive ion channel protein, partial [Piscinibacter sp.]
MARTLDTTELQELLGRLAQPAALTELGVLAGCLVLAWLIVRLLRGRAAAAGSIWFGDRIVDGVLFPVLALGLAFGARLLLVGTLPIAVFKLAIPILL